MKRIPIITTAFIVGCTSSEKNIMEKLNYPVSKKVDTTHTYFGKTIADPYNYLEDDMSEETAQWVRLQNELTDKYLSDIPYRSAIKEQLEEVWNYQKMSAPFQKGEYIYFFKNDGLQNQSVLFRKGADGKEEEFLNPNNFSKDGTTSLGGLSFTNDGSLLAYSISEGGSDWRKIIVIDTKTKEQLEPAIVDAKFTSISWRGNEGFFYSSYDKPSGSELSAKTDHHKLYYHKLGTPQSEDVVVFGASENEKYRYVSASTSKEGDYLFVNLANATYGSKLYVKDINNNKPFIPIVDDLSSNTHVVAFKDGKVYMLTDRNSPNKRLVVADIKALGEDKWQNVIEEKEHVLSVMKAGDYFFAHYLIDATSRVYRYTLTGELLGELELPGVGTVSGFSADDNQEDTFFVFANYATPSVIFKLNIHTGKYEMYWEPNILFNSEDYVSKQVFYTSEDGTRVPMIITHHKDITLNGKNPTLLYGYGGFNVSLTPSFSPSRAVWLENGGVLAVANLRGGGEYGKEWHNAGTQLKKQNVFDDFIAAAEYLHQEKYSSPSTLAIQGGSNGGLLVGAVMTQRPDLMKVALPAVGVLDMLRYHKFTAGAGWAYDYGTADDSPEMFEYLLGYSPLHQLKSGICYPATLVTTADHDDRVVPAHSFKFAATLQSVQSCLSPTLIRVETNAGHGAGTPVSKTIEQNADIFAFTLWNMGITKLSPLTNKEK